MHFLFLGFFLVTAPRVFYTMNERYDKIVEHYLLYLLKSMYSLQDNIFGNIVKIV